MSSSSHTLPPHVERAVLQHHFNHATELVLPFTAAPSVDQAALLPGPASYWHVCGPLVDLLTPAFIERHVRGGTLLALSATAVDQAGTLAITHPGKLLIICERHLYETLGLEGLPSSFSPDKSRWCVQVDLLDARVAPGGCNHERMTAALRRLGVVQLLVLWRADGEAQEPSFAAGLHATRHESVPSRREFAQLAVPDLRGLSEGESAAEADVEAGCVGDEAWGSGGEAVAMATEEEAKDEDDEEEEDDDDEGSGDGPAAPGEHEATGGGEAGGGGEGGRDEGGRDEARRARGALVAQLHEWLGMVALGLRVGLYSAPPPAATTPAATTAAANPLARLPLHALPLAPPAAGQSCHALRWRGMLAPRAVRALLGQAAALVERGAVPWAALTVWGFADAPVSWGLKEHTATLGGAENDYVVVVLPGGRCLLRYASCGSTRDFVCEAKV